MRHCFISCFHVPMTDATPEIPAHKFRQQQSRPEHDEQVAVIKWAQAMTRTCSDLALLHAVPNGGARNEAVGGKLKAEGVRAGVPDLCLPVPRDTWHGLYIEMKRRTGGQVRQAQRWWIDQLRSQGYRVAVCEGSDEAIELLEEYLDI